MAVTLVPCADALRGEIHTRYGQGVRVDWVGDRAHAERVSDHNPERWAGEHVWDGQVHAIDVYNFAQLDPLMEWLRARAARGLEPRLKYLIRNRRICSAKTGWEWFGYDGDNPHDHHGHFSFSSTTRYENDRSSWLGQYDRATPAKTPQPAKTAAASGTASNESPYRTWQKASPGSRVLHLWDAGDDVEVLQAFIGNVKADGYYGRSTEAAVKWYQDLRGIHPIDGVAGPKTWAPILKSLH